MSLLKNEIINGQQLHSLAPNEVKWMEQPNANYGIPGNNRTGVMLHPLMLQRHLLFVGSIGSGKTVSMNHVIRGLRSGATEDDIFVFFDAKGDYLKDFYRQGDCILTNEVGDAEGVVSWNIFQDILATPLEKRDEVIWEIASSLFREDIERSSAPIFAAGARDLFAAILSAKVRDMEEGAQPENHATLIQWVKQATDVHIRNLLLRHQDLSWVRSYVSKDNQASTNQSFLMHLYQNLFGVFNGAFRQAGDFSLTGAIQARGGKAVFLEYDISSSNVLKPIYTMILDIAMKNILGTKEKDCRGNVFFILDEFPLIPKLNYMDNALNFGRSLGVRIIAGIQNIGQVKHVYQDALADSILSGFGTVFAFRLFDEPSRSYVINRHGKNKRMIAYSSANANKGVQESVIDGNVIEDWDLTELEIGQCIVSPFNGQPFRFHPVKDR